MDSTSKDIERIVLTLERLNEMAADYQHYATFYTTFAGTLQQAAAGFLLLGKDPLRVDESNLAESLLAHRRLKPELEVLFEQTVAVARKFAQVTNPLGQVRDGPADQDQAGTA